MDLEMVRYKIVRDNANFTLIPPNIALEEDFLRCQLRHERKKNLESMMIQL